MVRREERRSAVLRQRPGAAWPARSVQRAPLLLLSAPRARSEPFPALACHRLPRAGTSVVGLPVTASVLSFHFPHCVWRSGLKGPVFSPEGPSRRVRGWGGPGDAPADALSQAPPVRLSRAPPPGSAWSSNYMNPVVCPPRPHTLLSAPLSPSVPGTRSCSHVSPAAARWGLLVGPVRRPLPAPAPAGLGRERVVASSAWSDGGSDC